MGRKRGSMKIVIDIPEEVYKCVMDGTYCGTLYEELKNGVPVDTCGDCISRQAAIDAIWKPIIKPNEMIFDALKQAQQNEIETLPSVEPERKPGKWIPVYDDNGRCSDFRCSACNGADEYGSKFCPNCGVKMEDQDGE